MQRWFRAVGKIVIEKRQPTAPLGGTALDPEVLAKLQDYDPTMLGEYQEYRYGAAREELETQVTDSGSSPLHGKYIYVLSMGKKLYTHPEPAGTGGARTDEFRHSAFTAAAPVLSAGQLYCWAGSLVLIDNASGHYKPKPESMRHILQWLDQAGLDLSASFISLYLGDTYVASEYLEHPAAAEKIPAERVPDVESIFGFVERQHQAGVSYSCFEEAGEQYHAEREKKQREARERIEKEKKQRAEAKALAESEKAEKLAAEREQRKQRALASKQKMEEQRRQLREAIGKNT